MHEKVPYVGNCKPPNRSWKNDYVGEISNVRSRSNNKNKRFAENVPKRKCASFRNDITKL